MTYTPNPNNDKPVQSGTTGPDEPDFFTGEGPQTCDWTGEHCADRAEYYLVVMCENEKCTTSHMRRLCPRHYVLELANRLDHLRFCNRMRKLGTPDTIRTEILRHFAAFGPIGADPATAQADAATQTDTTAQADTTAQHDSPGSAEDGNPADDRPPVMTAEADGNGTERMHGATAHVAYDALRTSEDTTLEQLRAWVDGLALRHARLTVEYFAVNEDPVMPLLYKIFDPRRDPRNAGSIYDPYDPATNGFVSWSSVQAADLSRRDLVRPTLESRVDPDTKEFAGFEVNDCLSYTVMERNGLITANPAKAVPNLFLIVDHDTTMALPVTPGSLITWNATDDGYRNQLQVCDYESWTRRFEPYVAYYDHAPLDPADVNAKIADLTGRIHRIIRDGVRP
ncbi:hypothetical protein [Bifidobacterium aerophilum]|uniref:Uncharacterized protein n=1 Tax=Bifidobacterium aerophilum TaxID=1798155 RepID=A0A6N9Z447_9BIFI|nr:hypothetical protein [Bifidobacterium aerophilum]NEG89439.1 hypothetical protein [Bifidobacterium aerophilum]